MSLFGDRDKKAEQEILDSVDQAMERRERRELRRLVDNLTDRVGALEDARKSAAADELAEARRAATEAVARAAEGLAGVSGTPEDFLVKLRGVRLEAVQASLLKWGED